MANDALLTMVPPWMRGIRQRTITGVIPDCGNKEVRDAIGAAAHTSDLALLITIEQGRPFREAESEIQYAAPFINRFVEEARRFGLAGIVSRPNADRRALLAKEPVGVSAAITPWSFLAATMTRKCAPALAAGCTLVFKPSELKPFSALALVRLAERPGFPAKC